MNEGQRIQELEEKIIQIIAERDAALELARQQYEELQELKKKLAFYEGPHTPPSNKTLKKKDKKVKAKKKRGAPLGHRGATREVPEPETTVDVPETECPRCHHDPGEPVNIETRTIEDISPPKDIRVRVTRYRLMMYECRNCGHPFTARHRDCPVKGNFGVNLLVCNTMLKYHLRGSLRRVQTFMSHSSEFEISPKGLMDMLLRVGDACKKEYEITLGKVRAAKWRHIDETGFKVNGDQWWLWIFRTDGDDVLVVIRKSRGRKVVNEILGKDHAGPDVVDGWKAYWHIAVLQRCWAHLERVVEDFEDVSKHGKRLSKLIHGRFKELRKFIDRDPSMKERRHQKVVWESEMEELVREFEEHEELHKPVTYIRNGLGRWYTCLLYPGMEPTNNLGEQAMREHVIVERLIGCFRSENGAQNYQYIASLLASWKLQGKNMFEELDKLLRRELCLV